MPGTALPSSARRSSWHAAALAFRSGRSTFFALRLLLDDCPGAADRKGERLPDVSLLRQLDHRVRLVGILHGLEGRSVGGRKCIDFGSITTKCSAG